MGEASGKSEAPRTSPLLTPAIALAGALASYGALVASGGGRKVERKEKEPERRQEGVQAVYATDGWDVTTSRRQKERELDEAEAVIRQRLDEADARRQTYLHTTVEANVEALRQRLERTGNIKGGEARLSG